LAAAAWRGVKQLKEEKDDEVRLRKDLEKYFSFLSRLKPLPTRALGNLLKTVMKRKTK
jgi:hypothetical protein